MFTAIWAFFRMPETKGRTYEELDLMFGSKLPTKKFKRHDMSDTDSETAIPH